MMNSLFKKRPAELPFEISPDSKHIVFRLDKCNEAERAKLAALYAMMVRGERPNSISVVAPE